MPKNRSFVLICKSSELPPLSSHPFTFFQAGEKKEGFLINENGTFYAYLNRCRHQGITLDWDTGDFYRADKKVLICKTHGATYHPATGACAGGPCNGKSLFRLPLAVEGEGVYLDLSVPEPAS